MSGDTKTTTEATKINDDEHIIRVVTWNVLSNWWYVFKCYSSNTPEEHRTWTHREKLSKEYLENLNGDIVCVQEINPNNIYYEDGNSVENNNKEDKNKSIIYEEGDLAFAHNLGYNIVLERSGNRFMRTAILYKKDLYSLNQVKSDFKFVTARLIPLRGSRLDGTAPIVVVSVHLPVGYQDNQSKGQPQVSTLQKALKTAGKIKEENDGFIIAGDFNLLISDHNDAPTLKFLREGTISKEYYEWQDENEKKFSYGVKPESSNSSSSSSKNYTHNFGQLYDATIDLNQLKNTFIVPDTNNKMYNREPSNDFNEEIFVPEFDEAVTNIFQLYCTKEENVMKPVNVENWLQCIHGLPCNRTMDGANQERLAKLKMLLNATKDFDKWGGNQKSSNELINAYNKLVDDNNEHLLLHLKDFIEIYRKEYQTNPWSVQYDFVKCNVDWNVNEKDNNGSNGSYSRKLDRIFYNNINLYETESQKLLYENEMKKEKIWFDNKNYLPNSDHPSDHLAVTCDFSIPMTIVADDCKNGGGSKKKPKKPKKQKKELVTEKVSWSNNQLEILKLVDEFGDASDYQKYLDDGADVSSKGFEGKLIGKITKNFFDKYNVTQEFNKKEQKFLKERIKIRVHSIIKEEQDKY
jgi:endonuclease/exonuclease/phosphatase family metal-dependent hydrolase